MVDVNYDVALRPTLSLPEGRKGMHVQNVLGIFNKWLLFQIVIIYENIHSLELYEKNKESQDVPHERPMAFAYLQNNLGIPGCAPWQPQQFIVRSGFRYFADTLTSGGT